MHKITSLLILLLHLLAETRSDQPPVGEILSPIGQELRLNCTVGKEFEQFWTLMLTSDNSKTEFSSSDFVAQRILKPRGIRFHEFSPRSAQLIFSGTMEIEAIVKCNSFSRSNVITSGNLFNIIIFGPPPAPTNLTATSSEPGSINITWSLQFFTVTVVFLLNAVNLNKSTYEYISTQRRHYTLHTVDASACDTYSFQVTAIAASGNSPPSKRVTRSIVPNLAQVANSVTHSLAKTTSNRFTLNIRIQNACPVLNYTVVLEDASGNDRRVIAVSSTNIIIDGLTENAHYTYYIQAENKFGSSKRSAGVAIMTTDVQGVRVICLEENSGNYLIQCSYVEGSDARGCVYTISSGGESVTGRIATNNTEGELVAISVSDELLLYDWESDGTTGTLPIIKNNSLKVTVCTVTTPTISKLPDDRSPNSMAASSPALLTTSFLTLLQVAINHSEV